MDGLLDYLERIMDSHLNPKFTFRCDPHSMHFQKGYVLKVITKTIHLYLLPLIEAPTRHIDLKGVFKVQKISVLYLFNAKKSFSVSV